MKRIHRIGTITFGVTLIVTGLLFIARMIVPGLDYDTIVKFWPGIFIMLGTEILIGNRTEDAEFTYDTAAIILMILLVLFAMGMGIAEKCMEYFASIL